MTGVQDGVQMAAALLTDSYRTDEDNNEPRI